MPAAVSAHGPPDNSSQAHPFPRVRLFFRLAVVRRMSGGVGAREGARDATLTLGRRSGAVAYHVPTILIDYKQIVIHCVTACCGTARRRL
jgi:hypothetical protein